MDQDGRGVEVENGAAIELLLVAVIVPTWVS